MGDESIDQVPVAEARIADEPGAAIEVMRRRAHVAPPPPPVMKDRSRSVVAAPANGPSMPDESEPRSGTIEPKPAKPKPTETTGSGNLLGQAKGNVRQISTRLPLPLRQNLVAIAKTEELTLGEVAMDAVRLHHQVLRDRYKPRDADGRGFAPPRRRAKRSEAGEKIPTPMSVTPEEAEALQTLANDVSMSVNRVIIECLDAAFSQRQL